MFHVLLKFETRNSTYGLLIENRQTGVFRNPTFAEMKKGRLFSERVSPYLHIHRSWKFVIGQMSSSLKINKRVFERFSLFFFLLVLTYKTPTVKLLHD